MIEILPSDILYEDEKIRILNPNVKKGVLVWHRYQETPGIDIPSVGLKSGEQMKREGHDFGRTIYHPHIFFRAPFYNNKIDYTSFESEVLSLYDDWVLKDDRIIFIRVDPRKTRVYSSEIRTSRHPDAWKTSEKWMTKYFTILYSNEITKNEQHKPGKIPEWNLYSGEVRYMPSTYTPTFPWNTYPINRCSEVLATLPHIPSEYFVNKKN